MIMIINYYYYHRHRYYYNGGSHVTLNLLLLVVAKCLHVVVFYMKQKNILSKLLSVQYRLEIIFNCVTCEYITSVPVCINLQLILF